MVLAALAIQQSSVLFNEISRRMRSTRQWEPLSTLAICSIVFLYVRALLATTNLLEIETWCTISLLVWFTYACVVGWDNLKVWDLAGIAIGVCSGLAVMSYTGSNGLKTWGDVYFFCGEQLQHCHCSFRWNRHGWFKASSLWLFVVSTAFGVQLLLVHVGLGGYLEGEQIATRDSFVSVLWRLIPYWLNRWEHTWGAEVSSMMFELPHFATELLIILPIVQILCMRLRLLATPPAGADLSVLQADVLRGQWVLDASQRNLIPRLRAHTRILGVMCAMVVAALVNSVGMPLLLENLVLSHPQAQMLHSTPTPSSAVLWGLLPAKMCGEELMAGQFQAYQEKCGVPGVDHTFRLAALWRKHRRDVAQFKDPGHRNTLVLVELALTVMRLSCEKLFVLTLMFLLYVTLHRLPTWGRLLLQRLSQIHRAFIKLILYTFPIVCWCYGAGVWFSLFVTGVFFNAPAQQLAVFVVNTCWQAQIEQLRLATDEDRARMNQQCQICWDGALEYSEQQKQRILQDPESELARVRQHANKLMTAPATEPGWQHAAEAYNGEDPQRIPIAFQCGHAYHLGCIVRWCRRQAGERQRPTCPMCQAQLVVNETLKPWQHVARDMIEQTVAWSVGPPLHLPATDGVTAFLGPPEMALLVVDDLDIDGGEESVGGDLAVPQDLLQMRQQGGPR